MVSYAAYTFKMGDMRVCSLFLVIKHHSTGLCVCLRESVCACVCVCVCVWVGGGGWGWVGCVGGWVGRVGGWVGGWVGCGCVGGVCVCVCMCVCVCVNEYSPKKLSCIKTSEKLQ